MYELELKEYEEDLQAEALIIFDQGTTKFIQTESGFEIQFVRHKKIKIFTEPGLEYAVIEIPLYQTNSSFEKLENLEAITYNLENGRITRTKLDPSQVYKEKYSENTNLMKFSMPNVQLGSIVEYKYVIRSPRIFYLPDWYFQSEIPTLLSEYVTYMIPFYSYTWLLQGASEFDYTDSKESSGIPHQFGRHQYQEIIYTYGMKDIPAFRDEEYITSVEDNIMKIDYQLSAWYNYDGIKTEVITTWPSLCGELLKDPEFGKYINSCQNSSAKFFDYSLLENLSEEEKFHTIINYVKSNFTWNGYRRYMATKSVNKLLSEKSGNSAEINLLLCGMLRKAGLTAEPVLLSTRDHGKIYLQYPFVYSFNYAVVQVKLGDELILADACNTYCPDRLLPNECLNDIGLIVAKGPENWVSLKSNLKSIAASKYKIILPSESDSIDSEIYSRFTGYKAMEMRMSYAGKYRNVEELIENKNFSIDDSIRFYDYQDYNKPFSYSYKAKYPIERINNKLYIAPFFNDPMNENPFKQDSRNYPIDMEYIKSFSFASEIEIPEGFTIEHLPEDLVLPAKLMDIEYKVMQTDSSKILVIGSYTFSKSVYQADDYKKLKYYCKEIISKFNERIVLVKE